MYISISKCCDWYIKYRIDFRHILPKCQYNNIILGKNELTGKYNNVYVLSGECILPYYMYILYSA